MKYLVITGEVNDYYEAKNHKEAVNKAILSCFENHTHESLENNSSQNPLLNFGKIITCHKEGDIEENTMIYLTTKILADLGYSCEEIDDQ